MQAQTQGPGKRADAIALALLWVSLLAFFWRFITGEVAFFQVDIAFMDHPLRFQAFEQLRTGHFPFWTNGILAGFPLFAEGEAGVLYPLSWLYFVLPPESALNAFLVVHFLMLGSFCYLFLRSRALAPASAAFGSGSLVFSSFMLVEHVLPAFVAVVAWLPLLLWLSERYASSGRISFAIGGGLAIALMQLAGDPLGTLLSLVLVVGYVCLGSKDATSLGWKTRLVAVLVPVTLGSALAGAQLLPTLEFLQQSTRRLGAIVSEGRFIPSEFLLTAFSPNFFGDSFAGYVGGAGQVWEEGLLFFVGWAPLFLVPFGLTRKRGRWFWLLAAGAGVVLSNRTLHPLIGPLWSVPPLGLFRWPGRAMLWYAFGLSVLSAYGFDALTSRGSKLSPPQVTRRLLAATGIAATALVLMLSCRHFFFGVEPSASALDATLRARRQDAVWLSTNWLLLLGAAWLGRRGLSRTLVAASFFASLAYGVLVAQRPEGVRPEVYRAEPEAARFLKDRLGVDARILALAPWSCAPYPTDEGSLRRRAASLPANLHLRHGLRAVGQFDLESTTTLARNHALLTRPTSRILALLAVDALVAPVSSHAPEELLGTPLDGFRLCHDGEARVYCRERRETRAFLVDDYQVLPSAEACAATAAGNTVDLRQVVLLERRPRWEHVGGTPVSPERVEIRRDDPERVELEIATSRPSLLVLADSYYPGWHASLDERPVEILAANGFVRAVAVPAGLHHLTFRYRPTIVWIGLTVSLAGLLSAILMAWRGRVRLPGRP